MRRLFEVNENKPGVLEYVRVLTGSDTNELYDTPVETVNASFASAPNLNFISVYLSKYNKYNQISQFSLNFLEKFTYIILF